MFKNIKKEFGSLFKSFNKLSDTAQVGIFLAVVFVLYYIFFKNHSLGFSFLNHMNVNEGFIGQGESITFYKMEGCGWCKKFQPQWDMFKQNNPDVSVREVLAGESTKDECDQNGVKGFPTILLTDSNNKKIKEIPRDKFDAEGEVKKFLA